MEKKQLKKNETAIETREIDLLPEVIYSKEEKKFLDAIVSAIKKDIEINGEHHIQS